jgi:hypothetical protein
MKRNSKKTLDNLLFKPLKVNLEEGEKFMVIFGHECITNTEIGEDGKKQKHVQDVVKALNITESISTGNIVIDSYALDLDEFLPHVEIVSGVTHLAHIVTVAQQLGREIIELGAKINDCNAALLTLRDITKNVLGTSSLDGKNQESDSGNLILGGTTEPLAHIVFKTVAGNKTEDLAKVLRPEEVMKIGVVLKQIVESHVSTDLEDQENVRKLKAEIEYKIVEALPNNLRAGDVTINTKAILEEIDRLRDNEDNHENGDFDDEQLQ